MIYLMTYFLTTKKKNMTQLKGTLMNNIYQTNIKANNLFHIRANYLHGKAKTKIKKQ